MRLCCMEFVAEALIQDMELATREAIKNPAVTATILDTTIQAFACRCGQWHKLEQMLEADALA